MEQAAKVRKTSRFPDIELSSNSLVSLHGLVDRMMDLVVT
jgi:hypothetical protein